MMREGALSLLVATSVAEEGLDLPACCLVLRFDLPVRCVLVPKAFSHRICMQACMLSLLVATSVAEEGLDLPACCLVLRL